MYVSEQLVKFVDGARRQFREGMIAWNGRKLERLEKIDPNSLEVANVCKLLGDLHYNQGDFNKALPFFQRGVKIVESLDPRHPLVSSFCLAIGASLSAKGESPEKILPLVQRALQNTHKPKDN